MQNEEIIGTIENPMSVEDAEAMGLSACNFIDHEEYQDNYSRIEERD